MEELTDSSISDEWEEEVGMLWMEECGMKWNMEHRYEEQALVSLWLTHYTF